MSHVAPSLCEDVSRVVQTMEERSMGPDGGAVMGIVRLLLPCVSRDRPPWYAVLAACGQLASISTRDRLAPPFPNPATGATSNAAVVCMKMCKGVFVELFARTDLLYRSAQTSLYQNREATRDAFLQLHAEWTELSNAINPRALQQ